MASLFDKAQTVVRSPKSKWKAEGGGETPFAGWLLIAIIRELQKTLKTTLGTRETEAKEKFKGMFLDEGFKYKKPPGHFDVKEGIAEGKVILCKRKSDSALNETEMELIKEYNLSTAPNSKVETVYRINPKYYDNEKLMEDASKKIASIKGLPEHFIQRVEGPQCVTDTTLAEFFRLDPEVFPDNETRVTVLDTISYVMFKPVVNLEGKTTTLGFMALVNIVKRFITTDAKKKH